MPSHPALRNVSSMMSEASARRARRSGSCFRRFCGSDRTSRTPLTRRDVFRDGECHDPQASAQTGIATEREPSSPRPALRAQTAAAHVASVLTGGLRHTAGVAHSQNKGGRIINEDSFLVETRELACGDSITLLGVFDGHGNEQLSHWLAQHFGDIFFKVFSILQQSYGLPDSFNYLRKLFPSDESFRARSKRLSVLNCPEVISLSLCSTFAICEEQAMSLANIDTAHGGSCATVIAVTNAGFFAAQVGDCSMALLHGSSIIMKSSDHRTSCRPDEIARVEALGGSVYKGNAVGMAFSSLNVTRSLGDLLWRANQDWERDNTRDQTSNQKAMDESLCQFSKDRGCVGVTSEPEWYSCCCHGGTSGGEGVVHWALSTNAPREFVTLSTTRLYKGEDLRFYLVVGSDGFWETSAFSSVLRKLDGEGLSAQELSDTSATVIGKTPHDDSTAVFLELRIDIDSLIGGSASAVFPRKPTMANSAGGSSDGDSIPQTGSSSAKRKSRRRSASNDAKGSSHLDYLFI